ncbi:MAG TPA: TAXI family TRAP transporter solute-binding subunit [Gammaproteobacteria bacterium]|nr:TAXI family TRAP transporter solute-binding subunit [Gammaproteobacteria bacterium]
MRVFFTILGISLLLSNPFTFGQAQELRFFRIGTGGIAGTYYPIGGMIAHAISNPPGSIPCDAGGSCGPPGLILIAQSANGSVANVNGIQQGKLESGFVQSDIAYWAYSGSGTFAGEPPKLKLRAIANLYPESIHIVAHKDAGIRRVKDLIGKRVSIDELGSGTLIDAELVLEAYGISKGDLDIEYIKPTNAIKRIRNRQLDAFFVVAGYPARSISELANDTDIVLVPISGPEADNLVSQYRFFTRDNIPANVYQGIAEVETVSVGAQWLVASSVDDETVYQITRSLWSQNSRRLLDSGHIKGKHISLQTALDGVAVPLHPGSSRYYAEMGMTSE